MIQKRGQIFCMCFATNILDHQIPYESYRLIIYNTYDSLTKEGFWIKNGFQCRRNKVSYDCNGTGNVCKMSGRCINGCVGVCVFTVFSLSKFEIENGEDNGDEISFFWFWSDPIDSTSISFSEHEPEPEQEGVRSEPDE